MPPQLGTENKHQVFPHGPFDAEFDILGSESISIVELYALAQLEVNVFPVRGNSPRFGQGRDLPPLPVLGQKAVKEKYEW
jgi:hypothetical protein